MTPAIEEIAELIPLHIPWDITQARADYRAHTIPEAWGKPARRRLMSGDHCVDFFVHEDRSVTVRCSCHEPVIDAGEILGLRPAGMGDKEAVTALRSVPLGWRCAQCGSTLPAEVEECPECERMGLPALPRQDGPA